jgi:hypothetical protein
MSFSVYLLFLTKLKCTTIQLSLYNDEAIRLALEDSIVEAIGRMSKEVTLDKTRIGKYCRTTVPEGVRKFLEVSEGDSVEWVFNEGKIFVRKASR